MDCLSKDWYRKYVSSTTTILTTSHRVGDEDVVDLLMSARISPDFPPSCTSDQEDTHVKLPVTLEHPEPREIPAVWKWPRQSKHFPHSGRYGKSTGIQASTVSNLIHKPAELYLFHCTYNCVASAHYPQAHVSTHAFDLNLAAFLSCM